MKRISYVTNHLLPTPMRINDFRQLTWQEYRSEKKYFSHFVDRLILWSDDNELGVTPFGRDRETWGGVLLL